MTATGKRAMFEQLQGCLTGDSDLLPYAELAARLGMTEGAVKVVVHRLRRALSGGAPRRNCANRG